MRHAHALPFVLATLLGCSGSGGDPAPPPDPVTWPPGIYGLEATIEYRNDHEYGTDSVREDYYAELSITPGGSLTLRNTQTLCRDPTPPEVERDRASRRKTFECQNLTYVLQPAGSTVRGELSARVVERIRRQGPCLRYSDPAPGVPQRCVQYQWLVSERATAKEARLTIVPR